MDITGNLQKMHTELHENVIYNLNLGGVSISMNDLIGRRVKIEYLQQINCIRCGQITKTSFAQGYCYPCFISAPETEDCVLRPELCTAHNGIARDMAYAKGHCLIDHFVYLAESGGLKVGVTRHTQVPVRWIDQGAKRAIRVARTPNRYLAGSIEVALKNHFRDKTNWRHMLTNKNNDDISLVEEKARALEVLHPDFHKYACEDDEVISIDYPVSLYPLKVKSINFDKITEISEQLAGIRGQYLIFTGGSVLNIRKHGGYLVRLNC